MTRTTGVIVNLGVGRPASDLRALTGVSKGPIISVCKLPGTPDSEYKLVVTQFTVSEIMSFDRAALEILAGAGEALSELLAEEHSPTKTAQLFALFAGLRIASRHIAFNLSLRTLLAKESERFVVLVGEAEQVRNTALWLDQEKDWKVAERITPPRRNGSWREHAYRLVADNALLAALASLAITLRHHFMHSPHPRVRTGNRPILVEASSRLESYLRVIMKDGSDIVLAQRRHMPIHMAPIYRIEPSIPVTFLDHIALKPRHILAWIRHRHSFSHRKLGRLAATIVEKHIPNICGKTLLPPFLAQAGGTSFWTWLAAGELISSIAPRKIVLQNDNDLFQRALLVHGRRAGVPVIAIQHGAFTEPLNLDGFEADTFYVWGQGSADLLRRFGRKRPTVSIIGHPGYAKAAHSATRRPPPEQTPTILYATRANSSETASYYPGREEDFLDQIEAAWPGPDNRLVIKPHPRALPMSWYRHRVRRFTAATGAPAEVSGNALMQEISEADYVICTGGTTVLEAIALKRPCIFILPPGREDVMGWSRFSCLHVLRFGDIKTLRALLAQPGAAWIDLESGPAAAERMRFLEYYISIGNVMPPEQIVARIRRDNDNAHA